MYDIKEGTITIDGKKIDEVNLYDLRKSIGIVPQDAFLFSDTIKNNIKFGKENATDEEVEEVKGLGVVGQQPLLRPGEQFEYTSWATLPTPMGTMRGDFFCVSEDAQFFQTPIPEFALVMPRTLH